MPTTVRERSLRSHAANLLLVHILEVEDLPKEFELTFGYHNSRAGHLEDAEKYLLAGIKASDNQQWSYRHELATVLIRQNKWNEAEVLLIRRWIALDSSCFVTRGKQ